MSYPRKIQTLIVEDDQAAKDNYEQLFMSHQKIGDVARPVFVRSYEDGEKRLKGSEIFHILILDLNLPSKTRDHPTEDDLGFGLGLAQLAANRGHCPIPVILVVSGFLSKANLASLGDLFGRHFWHGDAVNKSTNEEERISIALQRAHQYCDVGIHIRDTARIVCPSLSPREEDLLRRCILSQSQCIGIDVEPWSADSQKADVSSRQLQWTKTLMGRFLLDEGMGHSRPTFFRFKPVPPPPFDQYDTMRDTNIMAQKLSHVKICCHLKSQESDLLVTQTVGISDQPPTTLHQFLRNEISDADVAVPQLVDDIVQQLNRLGEAEEDQVPIHTLLWGGKNADQIQEQWERFGGKRVAEEYHLKRLPVECFQELQTNYALVWVKRCPCTHGDLNATNIAVDRDGTRLRAFIFDAEGVQPNTNIRDLAYLEVTTLLYQRLDEGVSLVTECASVYGEVIELTENIAAEAKTPGIRNTLLFIRNIRKHAFSIANPQVYALTVFDCALGQLGGLSYGISNNHISNPDDAALLAGLVTKWLELIASNLLETTD